MSFHFWYLLLLPILFIPLFIKAKNNTAVTYGDINSLLKIPIGLRAKIRSPILFILTISLIATLSIGAAGPYSESILDKEEESRNIILTLDISGSMQERDFVYQGRRINRLEAVKRVVSEFITARKLDRIGIVVFGTNAFLQSPLTRDHKLVIELVEQLRIGMAGEGTAIGDGLGLSLKRIQDIPGSSKTIILLTDGANHHGTVSPIQAANIAKDLKIKVHTIGIGSDKPLSQRSNIPFWALPASGQVEFDEETLKKIAETTGGVYFNAHTLDDLQKVYAEIDKLETSAEQETPKKIIDDLTIWASIISLALYLILIFMREGVFLKIP